VSRASVAAAAAAAYAALAVLVAAGALTGIDQWAVDHLMPGADFSGRTPTLADALVPLRDARWHGVTHVVAELVTLPASFTPATVIVALACLALRGRAAVALAALYAAANAVEAITKAVVTRPALSVAGFASSYPSGHAIRAVLVAVAVAAAWPRAQAWATAWAVAAVALVEIGGFHVPSDIAGGLLIVAALLATTWSSRPAASSPGRRPSRASRLSSRVR
jgi:hypothetical protein